MSIYLDAWSEHHVLSEYCTWAIWAIGAARAALFGGDEVREKFYEKLVNEIMADSVVVYAEHRRAEKKVFGVKK